MRRNWFSALAAFVMVSLIAPALSVRADPRPWTFTYDLYREGKGNVEFEQWVTLRHHKNDEPGYERIDFREEIEIGVTDWMDLGIYLPKWRYEDTDSHTGTRFDGIGVEMILYFSNPITDPVGFGFYNEITVGERSAVFEQKLLFQKDVGPWALGYNLIFETEIEREDGENEVEGVIEHAVGVSYQVSRNLRLGAELVVESVYADWSRYEKTEVYFGPAINFIGGKIGGSNSEWWITVTPTYQLTHEDDEPNWKIRLVTGIVF